MCKGLIIVLLSLFVPFMGANAQRYLFDHYTVANGLPSNTLYRCACDTEGFLWIATSSGAVRFDGKFFDVFHESDGLPDNDLVNLFIDSRNRIWFFGFNGRVSFYTNGKMHTAITDKWLQPLQSGIFVQYSVEDPAHNIYLLRSNGNIQCISAEDSVASLSVTGNLFFIRNNIWRLPDRVTGPKDYFFHRIYDDAHIPLPAVFIHSDINKQSVAPSIYGNLCCVKHHSVYFMRPDGGLPERICSTPEILGHAKFLNDSSIILLTTGNGAYIYNTRLKRIVRHLLPGETLTDAFMNAHGDLWCTSLNSGLFYQPASRGKALYITADEHLADEKCTAIYVAPDNSIWAGMDNATLQQWHNDKLSFTTSLTGNRKTFGRINTIVYLPSGYLAISSDVGMFLMNPNGTGLRCVGFNAPEKVAQLAAVKSCSVATNGDLLIAVTTFAQRLPAAEMNAQKPVSQSVLSSTDRILCVFEDRHRQIWLATSKGLCVIKGNDTIYLYRNNKLLNRRILQIGETASGYIILATDGDGLIALKDEVTCAHINAANGLPGDICRKIFITGDTVYTATPDGIGIAAYDEKKGLFVHAVTGKDGLLSVDCRDVCVAGNRLYIATDKGIAVLPLGSVYRTAPVPHSYLKSITADGKIIAPQGNRISLRYGVRSIAINYGCISQNAMAGIEYRYRTSPDDDWTVTGVPSFVYNDPNPKQLFVTIQSRYKGGDWDRGFTIDINIVPRFYQRRWFLLLLVLFLAAGTCAGVMLHYRKKRRQLYNRHRLAKLESQASQAMMNPHFVFNALNSVQHFINGHDNYAANQYLTRFSRLIRRHLELNRKQYISLEEEFDFLRLYLEIEKSRCDNKLSFRIKVHTGIVPDETFIPVLILQPLVENAVWHGITPKEEGGCINITAGIAANGDLEISVTDNGVGFKAETLSTGRQSMGLGIIQDRLQLLSRLYNQEFSILYKNTDAGHTEIVVRCPLLNKKDLIPVA
ncbi:sensor histidine kinase [Chitinophagaceae bacterium MMS25-I14]